MTHVIPSFPINLVKVPNPLTEITIEEEVISSFPGVSGTKHTINSIIYMPMPSFHHILSVESIHDEHPGKDLDLHGAATFPNPSQKRVDSMVDESMILSLDDIHRETVIT